ncbi:MAG: hypothetical protein GF401_16130 [Chitinivibrionales bacterium]|nr:hypothetical protein [Chitinivibrionales bacterium]
MKLNPKACGLSFGLVWGLGIFFLTWWLIMFRGISREKLLIGEVYRGYEISPKGSIIGLLWGFVDGLLGGALYAWAYNIFDEKPHCRE